MDHFTDGNKFIEDVFVELQHIEQAMADGPSSRMGRYVNAGDWFVQPSFALACLRKRLRRPSHQPIQAGVSFKGLARLCHSYLRNATFSFDTRAAAVNIRQRFGEIQVIRSFYPFASEPATVKALMESPPGCPMLAAEIENRRIVAATRHLLAPEIIAKDLSARCPFLVEEFVGGRVAFRRRDHVLLSQKLLPSLQQHYAAYGVSCGPINSFFDGNVRKQVEQAAELLPWEPNWRDRRQFLSVVGRLADSGKQLTLSFCHGDLSVGHVAVSDDGRIFLLDWEKAGVQPIALDLAEILRTCRRYDVSIYQGCERLLSEVSLPIKSSDLFSPAEQMFLASLRRILAWKAKFQACSELQGKDPMADLKLEFGNANELLKYALR